MKDTDDDTAVSESDSDSEVEYEPARQEAGDPHTVRARDKLREQMQADIDRFLKSGGQIQQVPSHVSAERLQAMNETRSDLI